jgi:hypothetical protein
MNNTFQTKKYTPSHSQLIVSISKAQRCLKLLNLYIILIVKKYALPRHIPIIRVILSFSVRIRNVLYYFTHILHATSFVRCKFSAIIFKTAIKHLG